MSSHERAALAWREYDLERAIHDQDRDAVDATEAARALVLDLLAFVPDAGTRDLFNACARLGRLLAERGASPSLAASTIEGAAGALVAADIAFDTSRLSSARAALAEGYFATTREQLGSSSLKAWEYPACAVRLGERTIAIAAAHPSDDSELLADWAARVALGASRDGVKEAFIDGPEKARTEIAAAFALVGITIRTSLPSRGWLRLPFWRT